MTKKSAARLMKDAAKAEANRRNKEGQPENTCWTDLENIYMNTVALLSSHTRLASLAQDKELIGYVADKVTLIGLIKSLSSDLNTMSGELKQIHDQHAGKTGGGVDGDEVMESITIYEQYNLFMERHDGVIMPTVYHITELFESAEKSRTAARKAAEAEASVLDPNVTTDVDFKEVPQAAAAESTQEQ